MCRSNPRSLLLWGTLLCRMVCTGQQPAVVDNSVVAKLDASITSRGVLQGNIVVVANGLRRTVYRDAFPQNTAGVASPELLGRFLQIRELASAPEVTDPDQPGLPLEIRFRIAEDDFLLPIHRQRSIQLDLLPMASFVAPREGGTPQSAAPERFREEVSLAIPADFTVRAGPPVSEERAFAQYRSEAKIENGRLIVVRELLLKQRTAAGFSQSEAESFEKIVRANHEKPFLLNRISRTHPAGFIQSVPPFQANHYGLVAYQQREYEAARQLFERAIQADPESAYAWNNLGRALAAAGDLNAAQKAYEKQISLGPGDRYTYNNLGLVLERQGRWDAAIDSLRKQLAVHPGDSSATANLPRALSQAGRWAEAETAASNVLRTQPANAQQRLYLSLARVCQGKAADPRREIDSALGARPTAPLLNNAAYYLTECNKEDDLAEPLIRQALDLTESSSAPLGAGMSRAISHQITLSTYLDTYGWLLFKQNKMERAVSLLAAAAALAPRGEIYAHLAQAEWKSGRSDLASLHWRESTYLEPGRLSQVPSEIASHLESISPLSLDRAWYALASRPLAEVADDLPANQPSYFFVAAAVDGSVQSARELDSEDQAARRILPAVRAISFPVVQADSGPLPTVHLVRVVKDSDGNVLAARSLGVEAVAIAGELAPGEFPLPAPASSPALSGVVAGANPANGGISQPRILENSPPRYSEEARKAWLAGTVRLACVVGSDGLARSFKVIESLGLGLDESAIRTVSAWRFAPAVKDGKPVDFAASVDVNFQLVGPDSKLSRWHLARVRFGSVSGAARPTIARVFAPRVSKDDKATVTVTFDIDEQGAAVNLQVEKTSEEAWARDVMAALRQWKFTPAQRDDAPLRVSCTMDFARGN